VLRESGTQAGTSNRVDHLTGYLSNKVPDWQPTDLSSWHHIELANVIAIRSRTEVLTQIAGTPVRYYSDKEEVEPRASLRARGNYGN
jgi:hypothetical protein